MAEFNVIQAGYQTVPDFTKTDKTSKVSREEAMNADVSTQKIELAKIVQTAPSSQANPYVEDKPPLDALMENINQQLKKLQNYLRFEKDDTSEKLVIFIKDSETNEIIRQIPAQEFLEVSKNITQYLEAQQTLNQKNSGSSSPVGIITNQMV
ncbi:hypothetical protein THMIRHAS_09030 [Thiosulfatimonas sediminis]|uniref:Flagellar protein FlaG n=1 Tax=Thiosulfatimonas sediminis TaxID=2675054 RepID=A0A6F8PU77_9GAMM|nr:flagellar protein FlaG [Thiosulfatimonas sediminis]BBP45530.1 hypothetical protein THMIRHAS_09030 [Thiosulfatimonas sediminis]